MLLTLALAAHPTPAHPLQTISSPHLLAHVLEQRTPPAVVVLPARLARPVLEQLIDEEGSETPTSALVVVGEDGEAADVFALAEKHGVVAVAWKDVEVIGDDVADPAEPREASERDVLVKRFWEDAQGVSRSSTRLACVRALELEADQELCAPRPPARRRCRRRPSRTSP